MFRKILYATDFSSGSESAFRTAVRLASETGAELVLAHATDLVPPLLTTYPLAGDIIESLKKEQAAGLEAASRQAAQLGAQRISTRALVGTPWDQIVRTLVEEPDIDLAVVGSHGRTGIAHVLLGSVAEKIVRHAPCSVLVVKPSR